MVVVLLACVSEEEAVVPSAWEYSPDTPAVTLLSLEELETAAGDVVATLVGSDPRSPPDSHAILAEHVDDTCPEMEHNGPQVVTAGDCTTEDGWTWYGTGIYSIIENQDIQVKDIDAYHREWRYSHGNTRVIGPEGQTTDLLGMSWYRDWDDDGTRAITVEMWGQFWTDDEELEDPWFTRSLGSELSVDMRVGRDSVWGTWSGGFSRLDSTIWAFTLEDLAVDDTDGCTEQIGRAHV